MSTGSKFQPKQTHNGHTHRQTDTDTHTHSHTHTHMSQSDQVSMKGMSTGS